MRSILLQGIAHLGKSGVCALLGASFAGCASGGAGGASALEPVIPSPPAGAWRPGEALAYLLKPPPQRVHPIDEAYLARTRDYRARIAATEARAGSLRRLERVDPGGRRIWLFEGQETIALQIDVGNDGTIDQTQYFGEEGLFAIVHRFGRARRVERIFWPPGEARIVEIRDEFPPFAGVWWRTEENPFPIRPGVSDPGSPR